MKNEIAKMSPEGVEVANSYLTLGNIPAVAKDLSMSPQEVTSWLDKAEVKRYVDAVYLDSGYRNRSNIASVLDEMIASKLEEAQETQMYTQKDLAELLMMAQKVRESEIKIQQQRETTIRNQTNVQINDGSLGQGNYGKLMEKLLGGNSET